jgi:hypothetical protein
MKKTAELIFSTIMEKFPKLELVIAWNHPMLRIDGKYVFGLSASKNHLTLNPFSSDVLESMESKLGRLQGQQNDVHCSGRLESRCRSLARNGESPHCRIAGTYELKSVS